MTVTNEDLQIQYRNTIGLFATGVTVLVAENKGTLQCMTANAVSSVSLEPLQLLVCPSKTSRFSSILEERVHFSVNILGVHQEEISNYFAQPFYNKSEAGSYLAQVTESCRAPRLKDCVASLFCEVNKMYDGGDHWIVLGGVHGCYQNEEHQQPLLFFGGGYHHPSTMRRPHLEPAADPYK